MMKHNLRRWLLTDEEDLVKLMNNVHIWNTLSDNSPLPFTQKEAKEYITLATKRTDAFDAFAIEIDQVLIGGVSLRQMAVPCHIVYELDFWLSQEYWEQGIMTDVLQDIVSHAFIHLPVLKIIGKVLGENLKAKFLLSKIGFQEEAVIKNAVLKCGKLQDLVIMSIDE